MPDCIRKLNSLPNVVQNITSVNKFLCNVSISFEPKSLYYGIIRKLGIIHAQFRMKCSSLKADLFKLHVIDDPTCICSNNIEDCDHFFFHCHMYISLRVSFLADLTNICNGIPITTNLLLFGSDQLSEENNRIIFSRVESFIMNSGRFVV
jgi:hypothetical protein